MLRSHHFAIENRPEVEQQSIEKVMRSLNELGAPDVQSSQRGAGAGDAHRRIELAKWLSDWHLVVFLGTCGLLSEVTCLGLNLPALPLSRVVSPMLTRWMFPPLSTHLGRCESAHSCRYFAEHRK
jgi:nuclear protein localization family protein 4